MIQPTPVVVVVPIETLEMIVFDEFDWGTVVSMLLLLLLIGSTLKDECCPGYIK